MRCPKCEGPGQVCKDCKRNCCECNKSIWTKTYYENCRLCVGRGQIPDCFMYSLPYHIEFSETKWGNKTFLRGPSSDFCINWEQDDDLDIVYELNRLYFKTQKETK